jgi:signal transduction histidine kinase
VSGLLTKTLRSSTFRVSVIFIVVFGAVFCALLGYIYLSTASYVLDRFDRGIVADRLILIAAYESGGRDGLVAAIGKLLTDKNSEHDVALLTDRSFAIVAGNLRSWPTSLVQRSGWSNIDGADPAGEANPALLRVSFETLTDGSHVLVGKDATDLNKIKRKVYWALVVTVGLMLAMASATAFAVTRRTVGRIESINATSGAIMQSGLGERVLVHGSKDEWDQLAENLNSMFDRIEVLMGEVKQATDNVAHDLRTPLTRLRGRLEKACVGRREPKQDQAVIIDAIAELDDVLRMFSSLSRISQIETVKRTSAFRPTDLIKVIRDVVELFDAAAENKNIRLTVVEGETTLIEADRDLLFDALANLVDNAIKHGREAGRVEVELRRSDSGTTISVMDDGPGIPAAECQNVFRRFYRLERSRQTPGNGLGLSLVAAVAHLHGAQVRLLDNSPGLKVELHFPST